MENGLARRVGYLEEEIASIEETLHDFEMDLIDAYDSEKKSALKKKIKEKNESLESKYKKYAELLRGISEQSFTENEVGELWETVSALPDHTPAGIPPEMQKQLNLILTEIQAQNKSAVAKLKVALPIIPLIASYELELDTESFLGELWRKIRGVLQRGASNTANPR